MKAVASATAAVVLSLGLATGPAAQSSSAQDDQEFIKAAGQSGHAEVTMAALAQKKTMHQRVRALAVRLERDHKAVNRDLMTLAKAKQVEIPAPSAEQRANDQKLEGLSGAAFDREYVAIMVKAHDASIAKFSAAVKSQDPAVRQFAEKTLPTLRAHQLEVEKTRKAIGGTD